MKSPFKLKSGNSPLFKQMGSSPVKQTRKPYEFQLGPKDTRPVENLISKTSEKSTPKKTTSKKTPPKSKPYVKSGGKATGNIKDYAIGSKERYAEYEARGWAHDATTKGGKPIISNVDTTKQSVAVGPQTAETTAVNEQEFPTKGPVSTTKAVDTKEVKPQTYTRSQRRAKRKELKGKGFSRKERKAVVQSMRAETALAEGKEKKAKRIAKRVNRKIASKRTRSASDKYLGPTSDRMVDLGL